MRREERGERREEGGERREERGDMRKERGERREERREERGERREEREQREERRERRDGHIAIIVVIDLVPIGSHLDSGKFRGTNIADDGHRPIQLAWHGKLLVQGEDVSTSTAKKRVVTPTLGAAIVLEKVLRTACARRVGRRRGPTATVIVRGMDGIGILRMWIIYGVSIAIRIQNGCGV